MSDNDVLKFRIANLLDNEEGFIEYPIFSNFYSYHKGKIYSKEKTNDNREIDINDILPISSYYYETIALLEEEKEIKDLIYKYENTLFKAWLIANNRNYEGLFSLIQESSLHIKRYYETDDRYSKNDFIGEMQKYLSLFERIFNENGR